MYDIGPFGSPTEYSRSESSDLADEPDATGDLPDNTPPKGSIADARFLEGVGARRIHPTADVQPGAGDPRVLRSSPERTERASRDGGPRIPQEEREEHSSDRGHPEFSASTNDSGLLSTAVPSPASSRIDVEDFLHAEIFASVSAFEEDGGTSDAESE